MSMLRAHCSHCCGLCCVVPSLLVAQGFPMDKPAETPCIHLDGCHQCAIHATRELHGYGACKGFDCFGAGQWVTQTLFAGAHWTDSPDLARQMFAAYRHWAPRFEAAALLEAALPHVRCGARHLLVTRIMALTTIDAAGSPGPTDRGRLRRETLALIRSALPTDDSDDSSE